jgi:alkylhydroperoxidase family enzyme
MGEHSAWHHARMPLIDPLPSDASPEVAELAQLFHQTLGFVPNSVLTMMRRPAIARSELKRLIGHIASSAAGCRYCEAHTIRAAERYGGTPERLAAVWEFRASPLFSPPERAALEFALAAAQQPGSVDETIGGELRRHWDDGEIVEIAGVVALFGFLNRWNDAMGTTLEPAATADGEKHLARRGWSPGKHRGGPGADTR